MKLGFIRPKALVHRLICSWHMAAGQLAAFQGGSDEHPPRRT
jgi:hypothetical protein